MDNQAYPISVRFADPWIEDNRSFLKEVADGRQKTIESLREKLRPRMIERGLITEAESGEVYPVGAVDASVHDVPIGDISTVLVQAARHINGETEFDMPFRLGPFTDEVVRFVRTPARMSREIFMLARSEELTIADNSFWSFLMEANQAITNKHDQVMGIKQFEYVVDELAQKTFPEMVKNRNVIAMPKLGTTQSLQKSHHFKDLFDGPVTDREVGSIVLEENEYIYPQPLSALGSFGVENRGFSSDDRATIKEVYNRQLYYTYYKPHGYKKRCYRIEAHKDMFTNDLFSSIKAVTKYREIAEPEPQFLVDFAVQQLGAISRLYSEDNQFRMPFLGYHRTRR